MRVSVDAAGTGGGTGRGGGPAATPSRITARGARTAATSRRCIEPRRNSPHSTNAATHVTRKATARSPLRNVSASSTFEAGGRGGYSAGRPRATAAGGGALPPAPQPRHGGG